MGDSRLYPSRREVVAALAIAGVMPGLAQGQVAAAPMNHPVPKSLAPALRWVQLALVEKDPETFDPDWWLAFFKRNHIEGACISAGGMCAYYPTEIPNHHRSQWLGDKDIFGYLVNGCRKLQMAVLARVDPHCIRDEDAKAHPEWVAVNANGQKARHTVMTDRWLTCALGPCNFEYMPKVLEEITANYGVDGFFANRWQGSITCYCDSCKKLFKDATGFDAPRGQQDAHWADWQRWRGERLFEMWDTWEAAVHKHNPEAVCVMNMGGLTSPEMPRIGKRAGMVAADRQGRNAQVIPPWAAGVNAKVFRSIMGDKPVAGISSIGNDDSHRWKDSVQSGPELKLWILECIVNGMRPWVVKFSGTIYDKRWIPVVEDVYTWHWKNDRFLRQKRNLARVAIVWSPQSSSTIGNARADGHLMGVYNSLIEARIPFEMVNEQFLDASSLDRFKLLILPGTAALSDAQCEQIRQFVKRGGSVWGSYETSLYNEAGQKRGNFGLADLLGVDYAGRSETFVKNSYMNIEAATNHPVIAGFTSDMRPINTVGYADVKPTATFAAPPLTRVPSYPDLPMEDVYPRTLKTEISEVYLREMGAGRVVYFPGDIDRSFWEVLDPDHGRMISNSVRWALNEPDVVTVTGPGVMDVNVWEQEGSITVHMVNLTNPMMMKGPIRELMAVGPQEVRLRLPAGKTSNDIRLLVSKADANAQVANGEIKLTIPSITDHEMIAVVF